MEKMMKTYTFTLIARGVDLQADDNANALFEAGCDDALVGRTDGTQYLDFERTANSIEAAVLSAVSDVEQLEGIEVLRIADAGLVSMADIASRTDRTRESVRLLITGERGPGNFPPPATDPRGRYRLWRWSEVQTWIAKAIPNAATADPDESALVAFNAGLALRHYSRAATQVQRENLRDLIDL